MRMQEVRFEIAEGLGDLWERYQQQLRTGIPTLLALDRMTRRLEEERSRKGTIFVRFSMPTSTGILWFITNFPARASVRQSRNASAATPSACQRIVASNAHAGARGRSV